MIKVSCLNDDGIKMDKKNISIEVLKFIALFLIANSHMDVLYGEYAFLATGGSVGDVLFFFCSGYTLFLGRMDRFDNWYKRRINRIYPSVFAWALVSSIFFDVHYDMKDICLHGGGWFVTCIMLYYVILYIIRKYMFKRNLLVSAIAILVVIVWYLYEDRTTFFMYGDTYFKWGHYFLFMLVGAYVGSNEIKLTLRPMSDWFICTVCLVAYYVLIFACGKSPMIAQWQILSLIPLMGFTIYLYKLCNSAVFTRFLSKNKTWICAISGLCLEVYIVQEPLLTDKMNQIFPLNLVITMIEILILAYLVRLLGRVFSQLFNRQNFDWSAVVKL